MSGEPGATLVVPARFRGPAGSGNGGWTAGAVAGRLLARDGAPRDTAVTVVLRRPPPLDVALPLGDSPDGGLVLGDPDAPVLTATRAASAPEPLDAVAPEVAAAAEERYAGLGDHPFPSCFVCGTGREVGDGLRIFPGRVADADDPAGRVRVASRWTPGAEDDPYALAWAALDCAGAWAGDLGERLMVLGTMTARVLALPEPGVEHVVVGADRGTTGRRTHSATTVRTAGGDVVGVAEHVWVAVDRAAFA